MLSGSSRRPRRPTRRVLELMNKPAARGPGASCRFHPAKLRFASNRFGPIPKRCSGMSSPPWANARVPRGPTGSTSVSARGRVLVPVLHSWRQGPRRCPSRFAACLPRAPRGAVQAIKREPMLLPWAPLQPGVRGRDPSIRPRARRRRFRRGADALLRRPGPVLAVPCLSAAGSVVGPELTGSTAKGMDHVYRSIAAPSAEIAPEYVPTPSPHAMDVCSAGLVQAEGARALRVTDTNAKATVLSRDEIDQIRPSETSIMPVGLAGGLGEANLRDLIAYLTSEPSAAAPSR